MLALKPPIPINLLARVMDLRFRLGLLHTELYDLLDSSMDSEVQEGDRKQFLHEGSVVANSDTRYEPTSTQDRLDRDFIDLVVCRYVLYLSILWSIFLCCFHLYRSCGI